MLISWFCWAISSCAVRLGSRLGWRRAELFFFGWVRMEKLRTKIKKLKGSVSAVSRPRAKLWMLRATTTALLWTCVVQLTALGEMWGPRVLKGWPACFLPHDYKGSMDVAQRVVLPPKSKFRFEARIFCACETPWSWRFIGRNIVFVIDLDLQ